MDRVLTEAELEHEHLLMANCAICVRWRAIHRLLGDFQRELLTQAEHGHITKAMRRPELEHRERQHPLYAGHVRALIRARQAELRAI